MGCNYYLVPKVGTEVAVLGPDGDEVCRVPADFTSPQLVAFAPLLKDGHTLDEAEDKLWERGLHLCKSSAGWSILMQAWPEFGIESLEDVGRAASCNLYDVMDEEGRFIEPSALLEMVRRSYRDPGRMRHKSQAASDAYSDRPDSWYNSIYADAEGVEFTTRVFS